MDARFLRQVLLREIGVEGQARIAAAVAHVGGAEGDLAHRVASRYARGAGFADVCEGPIDVAVLAPPELVRSHACRSVLAGARASLAALRDALGREGVTSS